MLELTRELSINLRFLESELDEGDSQLKSINLNSIVIEHDVDTFAFSVFATLLEGKVKENIDINSYRNTLEAAPEEPHKKEMTLAQVELDKEGSREHVVRHAKPGPCEHGMDAEGVIKDKTRYRKSKTYACLS